jgi:hypothetical protein
MSAAPHEPTPAAGSPDQGLRERLRAELVRLHDQTSDPRSRADLEHLLGRLQQGGDLFVAGDPPWAAPTATEAAHRLADQQAAVEAARAGEPLAELGWQPAGQAAAAELRRRNLR